MNDREFADEIEEIIEQNRLQAERFNSRLNLKLEGCSMERKTVTYAFEVKEWCLNPYGGIHGGVICSLFDKMCIRDRNTDIIRIRVRGI